MTAAGERQKRFRARQRNGESVVPVIASNEMIAALLDRGWLAESDSEDRNLIGKAIADMLADIANLPTKNTVTRHCRSRGIRGSMAQTKPGTRHEQQSYSRGICVCQGSR